MMVEILGDGRSAVEETFGQVARIEFETYPFFS
jgi:hypothetical protein